MSEREELAEVIQAAFFHPSMNTRTGAERCLAAADAILSRRPADDEGLLRKAKEALEAQLDLRERMAGDGVRSDLVNAHYERIRAVLREMEGK